MQDNNLPNDFYNSGQNDPYSNTSLEQNAEDQKKLEDSLKWTASEFIYHEKTIFWYLALISVTMILALLSFILLGRDLYALIIIIVLGFIFGVAGARKPRVLQYTVDNYGIVVDNKPFGYETFKSFSIIDDNPISSLLFMPTKRFGTVLTVYVPEEYLDEVISLVSNYLPIEKHNDGFADKFLNKIRF